MATLLLITRVNIKVKNQQLERILFIQYPIKFMRGYTEVQALLDSKSKVNSITPIYIAKLELYVCLNNVGAQKTNRPIFLTYDIVLINF